MIVAVATATRGETVQAHVREIDACAGEDQPTTD
jgi:hypothetical protein